MRVIKIALWALLLGLSILWIAASLPLPETLNVIAVRNLLVQYSGVLGFGSMSVAMILAARWTWVDGWLNGLDKSYRLHKWLGIVALVAAIAHWIFANGPKWAVSWGLMDAPGRRGQGGAGQAFGAAREFLNSQRGTAELLGEWAFYAAVLLIVVALFRRVPYRFFASTHTLLAVAYLALVFHAVVLMNSAAWSEPLGIAVAVLMVGGVVTALLALTRQIGRGRQVSGRIVSVRNFPSMKVTEAEIEIDQAWRGHKAGQFAFVTFDPKEGKHPFTIASAWSPSARSITIISKALGDYTNLLPEKLAIGNDVTVEGPYGRFTFNDAKERQIWIGAGIGITPFIARLKHMAEARDDRRVDLIHCVPDIAPEARDLLDRDVASAGVDLHLMIDSKDGILTGSRLRDMLPDWASASVWFCGPAAFGEALRKDLVAHGLRPADFHQELFNMR